jgi:hypothetical protein
LQDCHRQVIIIMVQMLRLKIYQLLTQLRHSKENNSNWLHFLMHFHHFVCLQYESESLYNWEAVSQSILASSPIWDSWPVVNVLSGHYSFGHHGASSLITGWDCLLLVILSLSGVTVQKRKLFIICTISNIYNIYNMCKASCQSRPCRADYAISVLSFRMTA